MNINELPYNRPLNDEEIEFCLSLIKKHPNDQFEYAGIGKSGGIFKTATPGLAFEVGPISPPQSGIYNGIWGDHHYFKLKKRGSNKEIVTLVL